MDSKYWSLRYQKRQTGWDIGEVSKPLLTLFRQLNKKDKRKEREICKALGI